MVNMVGNDKKFVRTFYPLILVQGTGKQFTLVVKRPDL